MNVQKINKMKGGWFIGDFEPSVCKTKDFEVCYKVHEKNEKWPVHYHKIATEINYLIRGKMIIQDTQLAEGDIFVFSPGEVANPIFLERCEIIVVKIPSLVNDKYEVS